MKVAIQFAPDVTFTTRIGIILPSSRRPARKKPVPPIFVRDRLPSDKFQKEDHPFDQGYWMRYDGQPKPTNKEMRDGWETCNRELV